MASWKKVLVSGSAGEFTSVTASAGLRVGTNQTISTTQAVLTGSFTGSFSGDGSGLTGITGGTLNISASAIGNQGGGNVSVNLANALIVSGTLNQIKVTATNGSNLLQIGLSDNVTIPGNLTVTGTTTTVSASSLLVTDKFIVLSSGSLSKNDGGIIIQSSTSPVATGSGYGFILDGTPAAPRWGVTSSLSPTANDLTTPDEYMVSAKKAPGAPSNVTGPTYGGTTSGYGNIYIDQNTGDIWIYSEQ